MPTPQPVALHASVSRAAWSMTCAYSAIPSSHRWLAERILATIDAHDLQVRLSVPPNMPPAISSSSTSFFARSHPTRIAGGVLLRAHGDLPQFPFSAYRDVDGVRGRAGYMDLDELPFVILALVVHPSSPLLPVPLCTPTVLSLHCLLRVLGACAFTLPLLICAPHAPLFPTPPSSFPLFFFSLLSLCDPNTLSSQTPTRRGPLLSRKPALYHRQRHLFLRAPEAQEQHYEAYCARFALKHHCTNISPFSAAPLLTGGSGQLFRGIRELMALVCAHSAGKQRFVDLTQASKSFDTTVDIWDTRFYTETQNTTPLHFFDSSTSGQLLGTFKLESDVNFANDPSTSADFGRFVGKQDNCEILPLSIDLKNLALVATGSGTSNKPVMDPVIDPVKLEAAIQQFRSIWLVPQ
ncbi:hypothetical protein B0H13DRAFT_2359720 [Mycena leptocephala]|nr:hypothetical protein B0H13DRAFT_2359720 [Mycena leptocephala]